MLNIDYGFWIQEIWNVNKLMAITVSEKIKLIGSNNKRQQYLILILVKVEEWY